MIPLSVPNLNGNEWTYIKECLDTNWVSSAGSYVTLFEERLAEYVGAKYAVGTVNGTAALHIAMLVGGVEAGDYVICPNITFIASANSIKYLNADPIFVDIDPKSWQMDLDLLENWLEVATIEKDGQRILRKDGKRISAIMPVHVLGNMGDMERLVAIANRFQLLVVEDSTEALGSYFKGKHSGTFGQLGCFSFNGNKIMTTGGGGMIVTDNEALAKHCKHLTTQAKEDPVRYVHDEIGYNYRLVNLLAAMGVAQLEQMPDFLARKKAIAQTYQQAFADYDFIQTQSIAPEVQANHWLYTIHTQQNLDLMAHLRGHQIQSRPLWLPMNELVMFKDHLYVTEKRYSQQVHGGCLSLPCSTNIREEELLKVIEAVNSFYK